MDGQRPRHCLNLLPAGLDLGKSRHWLSAALSFVFSDDAILPTMSQKRAEVLDR